MDRASGCEGDYTMEELQNGNIVLGICAMDVKARSKSMSELIKNLITSGQIDIIIFGEDTILNEPVENWPLCNCLIAFYSDGFPLDKAIQYVELRRKVLRILDEAKIPNPRHLTLYRDRVPHSRWRQGLDWIEIDGQLMEKPFIEKPVLADDHNNIIYYRSTEGGGSRHLFRKVGNVSSRFRPNINRVREDSSYIYQEYLVPDNFLDVKVYAVGSYIYSEARKAPVLDGQVERSEDGHEARIVVELTEEEKDMVRRTVDAFGQMVCGMDILRANGRSYIIDVNGWSFVKGKGPEQQRYFRTAAATLYKCMQEALVRGPSASPPAAARPHMPPAAGPMEVEPPAAQ